MKNITSVLLMTCLAIATPSLPTAAAAASSSADNGAVDFCKMDVPANFPGAPLGNCVAIQSTTSRGNLNGAVPNICNFAEAEFPDVFYSFYASHAECVRDNASVFLG